MRWFFLGVLISIALGVIGAPGLSRALEVEMPTCEMISFEMANGASLQQAVLNIVAENKSQEKTLFEATMKTLVRDAIGKCKYSGTRVIEAAFRGGVPVSVLFDGAFEAVGDREAVNEAIRNAGAKQSEIDRAEAESKASTRPSISIFKNGSPPIGSGLDSFSKRRP